MNRAMVEKMQEWLGARQGDAIHKHIIDTYNGHKPLARGYKVKYTDSWCAATISAAAIECGYTDLIPTECSCAQMINLCKGKGIWIEDDSYKPTPGDIIFYDWNDDGIGDCKGHPEHVGLVEKVTSGIITVIEGNKNKEVARRSLLINGKYIRGFAAPRYQKSNTTKKEIDKKAIWDYLIGNLGNAYGAAGLMGNLDAESGLKSDNLQNSANKRLNATDEQYTKEVDAGTYTAFAKDSAGYGIAQWTYHTRKQALLEYAKKKGVSIADTQMQLEFLMMELQSGYKHVLNSIKNAKSVKEASDAVLIGFEKPKDQSEAVKKYRAEIGQKYYLQYAEQKIEKVDAAMYKDAAVKGTYKTTANLNMRTGAGTERKIIKVLPKGTKVNCYGFYNVLDGVKWLYIQYGNETGYCSEEYLEK